MWGVVFFNFFFFVVAKDYIQYRKDKNNNKQKNG